MISIFIKIFFAITSLVNLFEKNKFGSIVLLNFCILGLIGFGLYVILKFQA